ncbi:MAG: glycosyltransferase family 2 protein, partial [Pseudanabaena sp.]
MAVNVNIKKQPLVSVGIPTYNRPDGLKRTLDCITKQTYQNIEIIISDNHSNDPKVEKIVKEFQEKDKRITYFKQLENKGAVFNFAYLLKQAIGEYFMWAADDDEWEPEFIQICLEEFEQYTKLVVPKMQVLYRGSNQTRNILLPNISKQNSRSENIYLFLEKMTPSMFYGLHHRESLVNNYEDMNFDFSDCYMITKILLNGEIKVLNAIKKPLYTAGVDGSEYIIKSANPRNNRTLTYLPYITKQTKLILSSSITLINKLKLLHKLLITTLSLFLFHEKKHKDANVLNKLRFILIQILIALNSRLACFFYKISLIKENFNKAINSKKTTKMSYSQCGEDLIIQFIFSSLGISKPSYIDIGAYDAHKLSNTAVFYEQGSRGINIEP